MMQFIHEEDVSEAIALTLHHGLQASSTWSGRARCRFRLRFARRQHGVADARAADAPLIDRLFRWGMVPYPAGAMDYINIR